MPPEFKSGSTRRWSDEAAERLAGGANAGGAWACRRRRTIAGCERGSEPRRWKESLRSPPVQPYEALPEEKAAVKEYALKHPELRHRELTWRMVDEDVAYVSPRRCIGFCRRRSWFVLGEGGASVGGRRTRRRVDRPDLGHGHQVRVGRRPGLFPGVLPGRVLPVHRASRAA